MGEIQHVASDIEKLGDMLKADVGKLLDEIGGLVGIGQGMSRASFTTLTGTHVLNYKHYALAVAYVQAIELASKDLESKKEQLHAIQADLHLSADNYRKAEEKSTIKPGN